VGHPRDPNYREHWATLSTIKPHGRLLDVGSHLGFFLRLGRGKGWELHGIEPSAQSASIGSTAFDLDIRTGYVHEASFAPNSFDVVTLVDVFEHVVEPRKLLTEIFRLLAPGGVLFVKVPNGRYNLLKLKILRTLLRSSQFDIFDSREHVVHYTEVTLNRMLRETGFVRSRFYVPKPIQTGAWFQRLARASLNAAARFSPRVGGSRALPPTDLAAVCWKPG
jgi:SAM-dependent methyltransferase